MLRTTKKGFSSKEIQCQLGLMRYEPVCSMVHKLRRVMGKRDDRYTFEGTIEIDECYFTTEISEYDHQMTWQQNQIQCYGYGRKHYS